MHVETTNCSGLGKGHRNRENLESLYSSCLHWQLNEGTREFTLELMCEESSFQQK